MKRCLVFALVALALGGCRSAAVGGCSADDMRTARTIVYDPSGSPAYAGQALLIGSCAGGGAFCHASSATRRYGAPYDLNFDPMLADDPRFGGDLGAGQAQLYAAQLSSHHHAGDIYTSVFYGTMPPGQAGIDTMTAPYVTYASASATTGTPIPDLTTNEGLELLRAWLACGSPVIEATSALPAAHCSFDSDCTPLAACNTTTGTCVPIGDVVPRHGGSTMATWSSLYASIIGPTCAIPACHSAANARFNGDLDLSSASTAYTQLVNTPSSVPGCATRVVPGQATQSLLLQKLMGTQPATCGSTMPVGSMLPANEIMLVSNWIAAGAMNN